MAVSLQYLEKTATGYYFYTGTTVFASACTVTKFTLAAGADAAKAVWRKGGSSGTIICTLTAPAGSTVVKEASDNEGWQCPYFASGSLHVTVVSGTTPTCGVDLTAIPQA